MLFNSQIFLLFFLPILLLLYYFGRQSVAWRTYLLIAASFFFYGYWNIKLIPLLAGSILLNWMIVRHSTQKQKYLLPLGIIVNLALLGIFKYADFFTSIYTDLTHTPPVRWNIILPLAISFFTFQQISYLADVLRGEKKKYSLRDYTLYISFFPQLIAGPIVRHNEFIQQIPETLKQKINFDLFAKGLTLLTIGLVKKIWIADEIAHVVNSLYTQPDMLTLLQSWWAAIGFSLQIYFDFSGYSDMAIGLGLLFGFILPQNFNAPYIATSIVDFWRRWHITLSTFLRDYLYIPLGGNRHGKARQILNTILTMLLGGLWHGAAWTFVIWGAIHGVALAINQQWRRANLYFPRMLGWIITMIIVVSSFAIFRAENLTQATAIITAMTNIHNIGSFSSLAQPWLMGLTILFTLTARPAYEAIHTKLIPHTAFAILIGTALFATLVKIAGSQNVAFIYFQF